MPAKTTSSANDNLKVEQNEFCYIVAEIIIETMTGIIEGLIFVYTTLIDLGYS